MLLERVALACARVRVIEGGRRSRRGQREGVCGRTPRCRGRSGDEVEWLEREVETALSVGLPAGFVDEPPLPLPTSGAVRFTGQAQLEAGDALPDGMFISASTPSHSVRTATFEGRAVLVVSGDGHSVGEPGAGRRTRTFGKTRALGA